MTPKFSPLNLAGSLIFIGVLQWFMTVLAAETLFPGYSSRTNDLSDLASTIPPNISVVQPSAMLFNSSKPPLTDTFQKIKGQRKSSGKPVAVRKGIRDTLSK